MNEFRQQDGRARAARNEAIFRAVNEQIQSLSPGATSTFHEFSCECAADDCVEMIPLTHEEYEHVRRTPTHFFVKPGHVYSELERVVETDGDGLRFEIVEKIGEAGKVAAELDPRS